MYLIYIKRHIIDWGEIINSSRFKAVLFGLPALTTKSGKSVLVKHDDYVNWYIYGTDWIPCIINKDQGSILFQTLTQLFSSFGIRITEYAYSIVQKVSYGYYYPGHKYLLLSEDVEKQPISIISPPKILIPQGINDHMNMKKVVDILTKSIW